MEVYGRIAKEVHLRRRAFLIWQPPSSYGNHRPHSATTFLIWKPPSSYGNHFLIRQVAPKRARLNQATKTLSVKQDQLSKAQAKVRAPTASRTDIAS